MANVYAATYGKKNTRSMVTGNGFSESYKYTFTAIPAADVIYFGIIPAGVEISEVKFVTDANTAALTLKLGYTPIVSADGPAANDAYWFAATAVTTAQAVRSAAHPILFDFPVAIIGTTAGATATAAVVSHVVVSGKVVGLK